MKQIFLLIAFLICITSILQAQERYSTKTGIITFEASVPSFEEVKATNAQVSALLNTTSGDIAVLALLKGFRFKVALMEEHFNENYIESSKYPKATFKGTIEDFIASKLSEEEKKYNLKGTLSLHGESKIIDTSVRISQTDEGITMQLNFDLKPKEFNINIPNLVSSKIAEIVSVSAVLLLQQNNK